MSDETKHELWKHLHIDDLVIMEYTGLLSLRKKPKMIEGRIRELNTSIAHILPEGKSTIAQIRYSDITRLKNLNTGYDSSESE